MIRLLKIAAQLSTRTPLSSRIHIPTRGPISCRGYSHYTSGCRDIQPWSFPRPPPLPTQEELSLYGLPLLRKLAQHASNGRMWCSGWRHKDGSICVASYRDVLAEARHVSKLLYERSTRQQSTEKGSKLVAHLNVPGWEYTAILFGAWGAGYTSVPLALSHKTPELEHVLLDSDPELIFIGGGCVPSGRTTLHHNKDGTEYLSTTHTPINANELVHAAVNVGMSDRIVQLSTLWGPAPFSEDFESAPKPTASLSTQDFWLGTSGVIPSWDHPAIVLYTSGTTGKPKGVVLTHRNLFHQINDLVTSWEWKAADVALHVLPLHHVHGVVNVLLCAAYAGARVDFQPFQAEALWNQWAKQNITSSGNPLPQHTVFMAVPTIYAKLLEAAEQMPADIIENAVENLKLMRLVVSGSAALPIPVLEQWRQLTGHMLLERYGMTEFAMALSNPYREDTMKNPNQKRQPGHVGLPLPSVSVRIVDQENGQVIIEPDTSGELQVRGPTVFQRYLNRPDATAEAFTDDGFFRTGDVAQFSKDARAYRILGRASVDIIKTGGHKVSALDIERVLLENPDIAEVAIFGIPDDVWGQRIAMVTRLKHPHLSLTLEDLRSWCANRMAQYNMPSRLLVVDSIPKNAMGKTNKKELVALFD